MKCRRCAHVLIEPREQFDFDFARLLAGGTGLAPRREWVALAAHCDAEPVVDAADLALLGALSADTWQDADTLAQTHGQAVLDRLVDAGLVICDEPRGADARAADERVRAGHWRPLSAVLHRHSRWEGVDTLEAERRFAAESDLKALARLGPPEPLVRERVAAQQRVSLARAGEGTVEPLLRSRVTCRNFDPARAVSAPDFAAILYRAFAARAVGEQPGIEVMKRACPSGGGLHPTEAYLLVQHVEGVAPGLYHYHPVDHALEPLRTLSPQEARSLALLMAGGQRHFMDAHVQVLYVSRVARTFWKYRNHMKAYRTVVLDVGHLSQMLYLAAAERGVPAFITAAVNEVDIERAFGLDPMQEGVIAMGGFGHRAAIMNEVEFDPLGAVWGPSPA